MRKVILSIFLVFICYLGFAQFPINQNLGSGTTLVQVPANGGFKAALINRSYTDTTQANLGFIDYYGAAMIYTTSDSSLWLRNTLGTKWDRVYTSGGSSTTPNLQNVTDAGNTTTNNMIINSGFSNQLGLSESAVTFEKTATGFQHALSAPTISANRTAFLQDTSGTIAYLHDITGGSGWSLTGNSGTTAGTNFIGTLDGQDFISKANNQEFTRLVPYTGTDTGYFGYIINSNYVTSPSNFTSDITAAGGASSTAVAGGRQLTVGATDFTQLFYIPNKWTASVLPTSSYRAVGIKTAANNGLILAQEVVSISIPYWARLWAEYDFNTRIVTVKMTNGSGTATLETSSALASISNGDSVECYFAYDYGNLTVRIKNLNTGTSETVTHTSWGAPNYAPTIYYPCVLFPLTTNPTVLQSLQVYIEAYKSPDFNFVGHSVLQGYGVARASLVPELIRTAMPNYKIQVDAMGSMRTQDGLLWVDEIQRINGKYTCIMFGANDGGVSDASFYASYRALRDSIVQQGSIAVHFGQLPASAFNFTARNDSLKTLYESLGDIWIDIFPLLKNGSGYDYLPAYDYGDGIHPSVAGNQVIVAEFMRVMKNQISIPVNSDYVDVSKFLTLKKNATYTTQQIFNSDRDIVDKRYVDSVSTGGSSSLAIGQTITSATPGSVLFTGTSSDLQQSNSDFFYDSTNKRLGVGTAIPSFSVHAKDNLTASVGIIAENSSTSATAAAVVGVINNTGAYGALEVFSSNNPLFPNATSFSASHDFVISTITDSNYIKLRTDFIDRIVIDGVGNVGIGVITPALADSMLTVEQGFHAKRGVRFSGLPTGIPASAKRALIAADGTIYAADTTSGGGSSTITNGTTAMSGFTNTYIPYNNAGTIGQYAISGTGNVAMSASPTFTGTVNGTDANFTGLFSVGANPLGTDIAASKSGLNIYYNTTSTTSPVSLLMGTTAAFSKSLRFQAYPASYSTSGMERADEGALFSASMPLNIGTYTAHDLKFWANNAQKMTLASNGDLSVANLTTNGYVKTSGGIGTFGVTSSTIPQADVTNLTTDLAAKQATLVSGTNIKTVNGNSLLGSGDVVISGSGSTTSTQVVATDADITAANNRLYVVPSSTLSANRNIDVSGLTTNLDYIEVVNYEPTYTYTFTGATVYLLDGVTTVTTITNPLTIIKRINGKLTVTN